LDRPAKQSPGTITKSDRVSEELDTDNEYPKSPQLARASKCALGAGLFFVATPIQERFDESRFQDGFWHADGRLAA
jgi:hypothetical protein